MSQKSLDNLKSWKKGQSGNPKGRPKILINKMNIALKKEGYRPVKNQDIEAAFQIILQLPLSKVLEILKNDNDEVPLFYKLVAKELTSKGGGAMLERIMNRVYGLPKATTEFEGGLTLQWKETLTKE